MCKKFIRFVAALTILVSIVANTGVARADRGALPSVNAQNLEPRRAPEPQPLDIPALTIPPASSLGVQFLHVATAANSAGYYTLIDHPLTNGNPDAIIFVTPNFTPGGGIETDIDFNIGVWYNSIASQWAIFNQDDATAIPANAAFNVLVPNPDTGVFVHKATVGNSAGDYTTIDYPLTNGNPDAIILVTPNWNPGGVGGQYDNHPIGVYYSGSKWRIFNQDGVAIPVGASFNVSVPMAGPGVGVFVQTATDANIFGTGTIIDNALTNGNPNAIILVTPNLNTGAGGTGVEYNGSKWYIYNQYGPVMLAGTTFNVYVFGNYKLYLPLVIR